jgi:hypothetical protein
MPETLFIDQGHFAFLTHNDKDFSLAMDPTKQLTAQKVKTRFQDCIRERKKDSMLHSVALAVHHRLKKVIRNTYKGIFKIYSPRFH